MYDGLAVCSGVICILFILCKEAFSKSAIKGLSLPLFHEDSHCVHQWLQKL